MDIDAAGAAVLILPTAIALDNAEQEALIQYKNRGGSMLVTGPFGARDALGNWTDWKLMETLFSAHVS